MTTRRLPGNNFGQGGAPHDDEVVIANKPSQIVASL
jgi:hypothetical protein